MRLGGGTGLSIRNNTFWVDHETEIYLQSSTIIDNEIDLININNGVPVYTQKDYLHPVPLYRIYQSEESAYFRKMVIMVSISIYWVHQVVAPTLILKMSNLM